MRFTNKDISVDTNTKLIKVFHPEKYTKEELYLELTKLWSRYTGFCRYHFPMECTNKIILSNGWIISNEGTKTLKDTEYGRL